MITITLKMWETWKEVVFQPVTHKGTNTKLILGTSVEKKKSVGLKKLWKKIPIDFPVVAEKQDMKFRNILSQMELN